MFGLTFEKLFLIALVAAFVIGPQRLPHYAAQLARLVRAARDVASAARLRAEQELGAELSAAQWRHLDVRQYDPRRIVRDALRDGPVDPVLAAASVPVPVPVPVPGPAPAPAERAAAVEPGAAASEPVEPRLTAPAPEPAPAAAAPAPPARVRAGSDGRYRRPAPAPAPVLAPAAAQPVDAVAS